MISENRLEAAGPRPVFPSVRFGRTLTANYTLIFAPLKRRTPVVTVFVINMDLSLFLWYRILYMRKEWYYRSLME